MRQSTRIITLIATAGLLGLAGCNGPSQAGLDNRAAARERVALYSAAFVYDQAKQELNAGRFDRALESIDRAIDGDPEAPEYLVLRGRILLESDRLERADSAFTDAIAIKKSAVAAKREEVESALEAGTITESDAAQAERRLVETDRVEAEAAYFRGIVRQRLSRDTDALEDYRRAHELDDERVQYLVAKGEMLIGLDRPDEAVAAIEPHLDRYEGAPSLLVILGRAHRLAGDAPAAAARYAEAHLRRPGDTLITEELMWAQFEAGLYEDCIRTVGVLSAGLKDPRPDLVRFEARSLLGAGRPSEADVVYRQLVRLVPRDATAWIEHASVAWDLGQHSRAGYCGARLTGIAPDRWEGWFFRGVAAMQSDSPVMADAEKWLRAAAERSAEDVMPHLALAAILDEMGDSEGAAEARSEADRIGADAPIGDAGILGRETPAIRTP